jgi:tetratricopeptide (TPR) repeat protein
LAPTFAIAHANRGDVLSALNRYEEALQAYDRALQLDPTYTNANQNKRRILAILRREDNSGKGKAK